jgi:signal transduction histidine kinase
MAVLIDPLQTDARLLERQREIDHAYARLHEAEEQLLQSDKMASIGQLAAGVAHEINNPIGYVYSNLGTLDEYVANLLRVINAYEKALRLLPVEYGERRSEVSEVKQQVDYDFLIKDLPSLLSESREGIERVRKIVQDLKDFSRVDHADWQDADINAGLDSTLNVVMNEVKYKAEVRKNYQVLPPVRCIAAQLNQVFMNLIVNAAHAIPERGTITLSTRADDDSVYIEVRDTGAGMSDEVKRRIFEPFYTTKPVGQGTGLGLSLSFSIVQKHGGRIEVESEPGVGTRFKVWIPIQPPHG